MDIDVDLENILMNDSVGFVLGVPHTKEEMTGGIDGTNKEFLVEGYPIYPRSTLDFVPGISDIDVYGRKNTVDTPLTVTALKTITGAKGETVDAGVTLSAAPLEASVDKVVGTYVEELEPFVAQDITPTVKQDKKTVKRLRSTNVLYAYGSIEVSIKSNQILSDHGLEQLTKLCYAPYTPGNGTVGTGLKAYTFRSKPQSLYGYITFEEDADTLGRVYMQKCQMIPDIPDGKQGDNSKFTIDMTVQGDIIVLLPEA